MNVEICVANGLRYIKPYYSTHSTFAKGRWTGKSLIDVLSSEFKSFSREEYLDKIQKGCYQITRGDIKLDPFVTPIKSGDIIISKQHKHEPPIKQWCISDIESQSSPNKIAGMNIIYEDDHTLVIDKPTGIPIHPTGQFYQNTLTEILKLHGKIAYPCYRLDKVTSGLLIMAKDTETANKIQTKISAGEMNKIYLAKVRGKFPNSELLERDSTPFTDSKLITTVNSHIYTIEPKRGFPAGLSGSKEATTLFYPLKYIPTANQTIVACKPLTGRTHQIRIHLVRLGFPILNDSLYCSEKTVYPSRLQFILKVERWEDNQLDTQEMKEQFNEMIKEFSKFKESKVDQSMVKQCDECHIRLMDDPNPDQLELYLHAWKYYDNDGTFSYETSLPQWSI